MIFFYPLPYKYISRLTPLITLLLLSACTNSQPQNTKNLCDIFREKEDWYEYTQNSYATWGVPTHVQMAIMHQESRFVADAQPPRPRVLGFIPWFRNSSAYGYPQAQDSTWDWYLDEAGSWSADRDDFEDASDFVSWYCTVSHKKLGISKWDTANQYLAYHEGHTGYKRKSYLKKPWLIKISKKVDKQARIYNQQLKGCKEELESSGWFFW
ncbi:MAG: hypothetical protein HOE45_03715 [Gammaproteobacteria bacterium]|jgi:hypothetical protein|nr:hypothetical protein [Gammaproteobacteria bacterium]HIG65486.1 hypothetical protein [Methyloprofundus sp.]HIL78710.1 hypothetical protein [Methylococcales bacterium]MBT4145979.1 hypothetical protein [Gammaproteobacteria bacterium]MBT5825838.1 hypothetical protein [Gammaproteobacteria bacterium]